jgi:hypothetical protein
MNAETGPSSAAEPEEPRKEMKLLPWVLVVIAALALELIVGILIHGYRAKPGWVGVSDKKFWDYLELLIVPAALAIGVAWLNWAQRRREREAEDTQQERERKAEAARREREREAQAAQRERELEVENQRAQDEALQAYLDQMSQLLLDKDRPLRESEEGDEVRTLARARTLTVLTKLDGERKRSVLQFLYESALINRDGCILSLRGANLTKTNLDGIILQGANLRESDLQDANPPSAENSLADAKIQQIREFRRQLRGSRGAGGPWRRIFVFVPAEGQDPTVPSMPSRQACAAWGSMI